MKRIGLFGGSFDPIHQAHVDVALCAIEQLHLDEVQFIPTRHNPWKNKSLASAKERVEMIRIAIKNHPLLSINTIEIDSEDEQKNYTIHTIAFQRGGYKPHYSILDTYHFQLLNNQPVYASSSDVRNGHIEMLDQDVLRYISSQGLYLDTMVRSRMKEKRWKHTCSVAKLAKKIAKANQLNQKQAYIAGIMHDVAKEMDQKEAQKIMESYFPEYLSKPYPIWHQWLSRYVSEHEFLIDDPVVLKAIEDHTTASVGISPIGKCLYVADKLDPLRGYDSSQQIETCQKDIHQGFRDSLIDFYEFSKRKNREIDDCFYEIYDYYVVKGEK